MRTLPVQSPASNLSTQSRTVVFLALVLFALSGLISGFAVGVFVHPKGGSTPNSSPNTGTGKPVTQVSGTPTLKPTPHPRKLGYPIISSIIYTEKADGSTIYTLSAYAVDQSKDQGHGNPVHEVGMTCKLWLSHIPEGDQRVHLPESKLRAMDINGPLTADEIPNALNFDPTTLQVQPCDANGQGNWKYQVSPSVAPGAYYLVVLIDWQGLDYNWSWAAIRIDKAS